MKLPKLLIPILVIITLFSGYFLRTAFTKPTASMTVGDGYGKKLEYTVDGLKCKGTSKFFISLLEGAEGVNGITTYATEHKAIITYDPFKISPEEIQELIEQDVLFPDGSRGQVYTVRSIEQ